MAASEFETVEDDGFIFKIRKKRLEEIQAAAAAAAAEEEGAPHADPQPVAEQSFEEEKRKKRLLTLKAMYDAELKAWERLEAAAAAATVLEPPPSNSDKAFPAHDPQAEMLKELQIEVESVEEYIKRLQDHITSAESTYKSLVKELREDANFRPADEIVRALTGHGSTTSDNNDVIATQAPLVLLNTICTHRPLSTAAAEQMVLHASAHEQGPPSSPQSSDRRGTSSC